MKVKNLLKMAVAALLISGMAASSALDAQGTGTGTANVVVPLAITNTGDLIWGTFAPDPSNAGTVTVPSNGGANTTTVVSYLAQGNPGGFSVTGDGNRNFASSITSPVIFTGTGGATMSGTLEINNAPSALTAGVASFGVGGTLTVGAAQAADVYTGGYTVTINYN